jgi:hypothetical protein
MVLLFGGFKQILLFKNYSIEKYIFGWFLTLYPLVISWIYWRRNRSEDWNFEFKSIKRNEDIF